MALPPHLFLLTYGIAVSIDNWWIALACLALSLIFGLFINTNYFGLGRMYRDRLMETFMPDPNTVKKGQWNLAKEADRALLSNVSGTQEHGPDHLINCNVVLVDADNAKYRGRGGDNFILSPLFCGSDATRWYDTKYFVNDKMTLATAMSISAAAANPNSGAAGQGPTRNRLISFLMAFLNLRLGYWAKNPAATGPRKWLASWTVPNLFYPGFIQGLLGQGLNEKAGYLELSDGGHFENIGIYELTRRKVDVIIVSEAGADPDFQLDDLANAIQCLRVDFGYSIRFLHDYSLEDMFPRFAGDSDCVKDLGIAKRGFAIAKIDYGDDHQGTIIYLKSTLTEELPAGLYAYKKAHPKFPDEPTADQFFDEVQLEAYRELGYQLCNKMLNENQSQNPPWLP